MPRATWARWARLLHAKSQLELQMLWAAFSYPVRKKKLHRQLERVIPSISIETTNVCNANCVFCAYQYQERPRGVMSLALFEKIVGEYAVVGGGEINLTPTVGEPLADPHLVDRIKIARAHREITDIGMYSNMISLERFGAETLARSGLSRLTVSTSGLDEDMYRRVYRSREYRRMFRNVLAFAHANLAAGSPVEFFVDMRTDRSTQETLSFQDYQTLAELIGPEHIGLKFRYDNWAGKITQDQLTGSMRLRSHFNPLRPRISPCAELYTGPMVYWDGRVGACGCRDVDASELIVGDANVTNIVDIWLGDEVAQLREEFATAKGKAICKTCTHFSPVSIFLRRDRQDALVRLQTVERRR